MLGSPHNRGSPARREARACAPRTARDPSTSVGMTESAVAPQRPLFSCQGRDLEHDPMLARYPVASLIFIQVGGPEIHGQLAVNSKLRVASEGCVARCRFRWDRDCGAVAADDVHCQ